ncbi:MAG TPA: PPOX class F420-dependent oxidoreductase [Baekduia sp.]|nr:PPOX class F420-dependent oxidoreductase [Baekduia sp.]
MPEPLSDIAIELLRKPNPAVIACVRPDGQPVTVATWYLLDGERVVVSMDAGRKRLDYLRADPRVTVTVLDVDGWQTHVTVQGRVVELRDDDGLVEIDRIAHHYTGQAYFNRERPRVTAWIELDAWHGWGRARQP